MVARTRFVDTDKFKNVFLSIERQMSVQAGVLAELRDLSQQQLSQDEAKIEFDQELEADKRREQLYDGTKKTESDTSEESNTKDKKGLLESLQKMLGGLISGINPSKLASLTGLALMAPAIVDFAKGFMGSMFENISEQISENGFWDTVWSSSGLTVAGLVGAALLTKTGRFGLGVAIVAGLFDMIEKTVDPDGDGVANFMGLEIPVGWLNDPLVTVAIGAMLPKIAAWLIRSAALSLLKIPAASMLGLGLVKGLFGAIKSGLGKAGTAIKGWAAAATKYIDDVPWGKALKSTGLKTAAKVIGKVGSRFVPHLGTALLVKDAYDILSSIKNVEGAGVPAYDEFGATAFSDTQNVPGATTTTPGQMQGPPTAGDGTKTSSIESILLKPASSLSEAEVSNLQRELDSLNTQADKIYFGTSGEFREYDSLSAQEKLQVDKIEPRIKELNLKIEEYRRSKNIPSDKVIPFFPNEKTGYNIAPVPSQLLKAAALEQQSRQFDRQRVTGGGGAFMPVTNTRQGDVNNYITNNNTTITTPQDIYLDRGQMPYALMA